MKIYKLGNLGVSVAMAIAATGVLQAENRSYDGLGNNLVEPKRGSARAAFPRVAAAAYDDGFSKPAVGENARVISNALCQSVSEATNPYGLTDYVWQWGQFLDHDITLAVTASDIDEAFFVEIDDENDPLVGVLPLVRTIFDPETGTTTPRQQVNSITSFIDGSVVYGSDGVRAAALRTFEGGRLKTSANNLMPMNVTGLPNANDLSLPEHELFLGGDVRSNEQLGLTCMHTVFVREHNRLATQLAALHPTLDDYQIYHRTRKIVGALIQVVTYNEFLPALLGDQAPDPASFVYDPTRDPGATNEFATALYRVGHTMVSNQMMLMGDDGQPAPGEMISVLDAFFTPATLIADPDKVDWILMGLAMQGQKNVDPQIVDNLRNQLFGPAGGGGLDLAALNIQRGRDHGLASYNDTRAAYGLGTKTTFAEITSDADMQTALASVYSTPDEIDLWIGCLAEDHMVGAPVGELVAKSLRQQFTDMAEGDRFFYLFDLELTDLIEELSNTRLADIIMRNSGLTSLQSNVFFLRSQPQVAQVTSPGLEEAEVTIAVKGADVVITLDKVEADTSYLLQRSTDGTAWEELTTATQASTGQLSVIDEGASERFERAIYRFVLQP